MKTEQQNRSKFLLSNFAYDGILIGLILTTFLIGRYWSMVAAIIFGCFTFWIAMSKYALTREGL